MAAPSRTSSERCGMSLLLTQDISDSELERSGDSLPRFAPGGDGTSGKAEAAAPGRHEPASAGHLCGFAGWTSALSVRSWDRDSRDRPPSVDHIAGWTVELSVERSLGTTSRASGASEPGERSEPADAASE